MSVQIINGDKVDGLDLYVVWAACADCARAIVETGVNTLYRLEIPKDDAYERWAESIEVGDRIMRADGVRVVDMPLSTVAGLSKICRSGELWGVES